ncbi:MAG: hypothetical protein K2M73_09475 [Lachnospiraceae bacterium]|nr:hypothetical protein [Lachnospiraceae bacterium]
MSRPVKLILYKVYKPLSTSIKVLLVVPGYTSDVINSEFVISRLLDYDNGIGADVLLYPMGIQNGIYTCWYDEHEKYRLITDNRINTMRMNAVVAMFYAETNNMFDMDYKCNIKVGVKERTSKSDKLYSGDIAEYEICKYTNHYDVNTYVHSDVETYDMLYSIVDIANISLDLDKIVLEFK